MTKSDSPLVKELQAERKLALQFRSKLPRGTHSWRALTPLIDQLTDEIIALRDEKNHEHRTWAVSPGVRIEDDTEVTQYQDFLQELVNEIIEGVIF